VGYQLLLVRVPEGASEDEIEAAAHAAVDAEERGDAPPPDPAAEARRLALAAALRAAEPALQEVPVDHAEIARFEGITEAEARRRYRSTELHGPEDGARIQISLHDTWASVEMPWGSRASRDRDLAELWRYLEVLAREGGFAVFDPQGPNVVDVAAGPDGRRGAPEPPNERRRPWWKLW
jgi:hypothetical protein